jgi:hypothetical protein
MDGEPTYDLYDLNKFLVESRPKDSVDKFFDKHPRFYRGARIVRNLVIVGALIGKPAVELGYNLYQVDQGFKQLEATLDSIEESRADREARRILIDQYLADMESLTPGIHPALNDIVTAPIPADETPIAE